MLPGGVLQAARLGQCVRAVEARALAEVADDLDQVPVAREREQAEVRDFRNTP